MVVPVGPNYDDYAEEVRQTLYESGFMAEVDVDHGDTLNKKIRNAQLAQFNFILGKCVDPVKLISYWWFHVVVGEKEKSSKTVNVRTRDNVVHGEISVSGLVEKLINLKDTYAQGEDKL